MPTLRVSLSTVAVTAALAAVPSAASATSYHACGGSLAGDGFWHGLGATGVTCSKARRVADDWIHRYYPQIKSGHQPTGTKYVDEYACKLRLSGGGEPTGTVTCGFNYRHLRFSGHP